MTQSQREYLRILLIIGGGVVTLFLAPWAAAVLVGAISDLGKADADVMLVWSAAGLIGVVAFWASLFPSSAISARRRGILSLGLLMGCSAAIPLFRNFAPLAIWGVIGIIAAVVVLFQMWLPNNALERTEAKHDEI